MKIAVAGKGGSGKSFIVANLARLFCGGDGQVYAVDADPCCGLAVELGLSKSVYGGIRPISEMNDYIKAGEDDGALYLSNPDIQNMDGHFNADVDGIKYLRMAGIKPPGSGCYCREHDFLRSLLNSALIKSEDALILDMCAGIEHLVRGTVGGVDILLVVSEPTRASIEAARTIRTLGLDLGISRAHIVANKIRSEKEEVQIRARFRRGELIGLIRMAEGAADVADFEYLYQNIKSIN